MAFFLFIGNQRALMVCCAYVYVCVTYVLCVVCVVYVYVLWCVSCGACLCVDTMVSKQRGLLEGHLETSSDLLPHLRWRNFIS